MSKVQIAASSLTIFLCSALPRNWQSYSELLLRGGFYSQICDGVEGGPTPQSASAVCFEQEKRIGDVYAIYMGLWSAGGAIAGVSMDFFGPRATAIVGGTITTLGTLLIAVGISRIPLVITMIALQGLFCNFLLYVGILWADYHPKKISLVGGTASASCYASALIPPILIGIWNAHPSLTFRKIWLIYSLAVMLPITLITIPLIPLRRPRSPSIVLPEPSASVVSPKFVLQASEIKELQARQPSFAFSRSGTHNSSRREDIEMASLGNVAGSPRKAVSRGSSSSKERTKATHMRDASDVSTTTLSVAIQEPVDWAPDEDHPAVEVQKSLWRDCMCKEFWLICFLAATPGISNTYYPVVLRDLSGNSVANYYAWAILIQTPAAFAFAWLGDFIDDGYMYILFNSMTLAVLLMTQIPSTGLQYFNATLFSIVNSYVFTIRYTACRNFFPVRHLGTMMGFVGVFLGATDLIGIPLARMTAYKAIIWSLIVFHVLLYAPQWMLHQMAVQKMNDCPPPRSNSLQTAMSERSK